MLTQTAGIPGSASGGKIRRRPLGTRLKAWWEGYELVDPNQQAADVDGPAAVDTPPVEKPSRKLWTAESAEAAELIWGNGFVLPGGEGYFLDLVKPFGLTPAMSVLDLSAGLGGGTRALTTNFGVWVEGMEPSPKLAELAMEKSTMAGLSKKAPIKNYDPDALDLPKSKFDCAFSREALFSVVRKDETLKAMEKALKDKGQIVLTDFVVRSSKLETDAVTNWRDAEPSLIWPWSPDDYSNLAAALGLELRVAEDMTDKYRVMIMQGWSEFMNMLKDKRLLPKMMLEVVEEAELWANRIKAIDSGDVRIFRFHLLKKKPSMMSNW